MLYASFKFVRKFKFCTSPLVKWCPGLLLDRFLHYSIFSTYIQEPHVNCILNIVNLTVSLLRHFDDRIFQTFILSTWMETHEYDSG